MNKNIKRHFIYTLCFVICFFSSMFFVDALRITVGHGNSGALVSKHNSSYKSIYMTKAWLGGNEAYCVSSGKQISSHVNYTLIETNFLISSCYRKGVPTYPCGAAMIISRAKQLGYDHDTTLVALRLWSGSQSYDGDGTWFATIDSSVTTNPIYKTTTQAILSNGYKGADNPNNMANDIIYAKTPLGLIQLQRAISLFEMAHSNSYPSWESKVNSLDVVEIDKNGNVEFMIKTNFDSTHTKNLKIKSTDSKVSLSIKSSSACEDSAFKTCYIVTGQLKNFDKKKCDVGKIGYELTYQDTRDPIGKLTLIFPDNTNYQRFIVYDDKQIQEGKQIGEVRTTCPLIVQCKVSTITEEITEDCRDDSTWVKKDPTLDCIINTDKLSNDYDFSNIYVHEANNYCTVQCRETVTYNLFDEVTADSTKYFRYENGFYNSNFIISNLVGDRECATEIKYTKWKDDYKKADELVRTTWNTLKHYENLNNYTKPVPSNLSCSYKGGSSCRCGCHCCSNTCTNKDGDSYSCCTGNSCGCYCNSSSSCSVTVTKLTWPSKAYASTNANGTISYPKTSGADGYVSCGGSVCGGWSSCTGRDGNPALYSAIYNSSKAAYEDAVKKREKLVGFIQDCNMYQSYSLNTLMNTGYTRNNKSSVYYEATEGYDFNPKFKDFTYESKYSDIINLSYKTRLVSKTNPKYCENCDELQFFGDTKTEKLNYWVCTGKETSAKCSKKTINIPKNTRAYATVEKERYIWQDVKFYSTLPTGEITSDASTSNIISITDNNVFPLEIGILSGAYSVNTDIVNVGDKDRKAITKMSDGSYSCLVNVPNMITVYTKEDNSGYGFYYRTIDLDNVFPTGIKTGIWQTTNAQMLIEDIQSKSVNIYAQTPSYEFVINPSNIRNIKNYNRQMDSTSSVFGKSLGYNDFNLNCDFAGNCESDFLKSIATGKDLSNLVTSYKRDGVIQ